MRPILPLHSALRGHPAAPLSPDGDGGALTESELEGARELGPREAAACGALLQRRHWGYALPAALLLAGCVVITRVANGTSHEALRRASLERFVAEKSDHGRDRGGAPHAANSSELGDEDKRALTLMPMATGDAPWKILSHSAEVKLSADPSSQSIGQRRKCSSIRGRREGEWVRLADGGYVGIMGESGLTLQSLEDVGYKRVSAGSCADVGMLPITDPAGCAGAAAALNLARTGARETPKAPLPEGCYLLSGEWLFLSTNSGNKGNGAQRDREQICSTMEPCQPARSETCLIHASYGVNVSLMSNDITLPVKREYAGRHGYRLLVAQEPSFEALAKGHFGQCAGGFIQDGEDYDRQTVAKFCMVWAAFEAGCETVMWTDSDAVITLNEVSIEQWLALSPSADLYWSVSDSGAWKYCHHAEPVPAVGCSSMASFVSCLNTGVFIMKNTPLSWKFLGQVMANTRRSTKSPGCSTSRFNPGGFDQCRLPTGHGVGDQCAVTCSTIKDPDFLERFSCYGFHLSPVFQQTLWYMGVVKYHWNTRRDAFVVNCIGEHKRNCTQYAIDHRLPPEKQGDIVQHIIDMAARPDEN